MRLTITPRRVFLLAFVVFLPGLAPSAYAWGKLGHETVAIIAQHRLSPQASKEVAKILGSSVTLAQISTCPDDIKRHPVFCAQDFNVKREHWTSGWHFINIPLKDSPTKNSLQAYCKKGTKTDNCVLDQIKEDLATLKDPKASRYDKQLALMFVVHFIGDVHQPLHCVNDNDGGGSAKKVWFMPTKRTKKPMNLHHLWDNIIEKDSAIRKVSPDSLATTLEKDMKRRDVGSWLKADIGDMVLESFGIAKGTIYPSYVKDGNRLGAEYQKKMQPIAYERIEKAGVRLAKILNDAFSSSAGVQKGKRN